MTTDTKRCFRNDNNNIEYDINKQVKCRHNVVPAVSGTTHCLCLSSQRRGCGFVLTPQPNRVVRRQKMKFVRTYNWDGFRWNCALVLRDFFFKKKEENRLRIPMGQSALVRITSTATSILREKLQQADLILPTSASSWLRLSGRGGETW